MSAEPVRASRSLTWQRRSAVRAVEPDRKPTRRQLAKARTLVKLHDAARFMFLNVGYDATTMRDLAARMGMSTGAIFAHVPDKAALWRDVMGCPEPTLAMAEEAAILLATRPDWRWLVRWTGQDHVAQVNSPDWNPLEPLSRGSFTARAASPGEALRQARIQAERIHGPTS